MGGVTPLRNAPTLRKTLLWGGLGFAAIALSFSIAAVHLGGLRRDELERSTEAVFQEEQIADRIVAAVHREVLDAMFYLREPRPTTLERFRRESDTVYNNLTLYLFRDLSLPERMQVETMKERHQLLEVAAQTAFDLSDQGRREAAEERIRLLHTRVADLQSAVDRFVSMRWEDRARLLAGQQSTLRHLYLGVVVVAILYLGAFLLLLRLVLRRVLPRLEALTSAARSIAQGDYDARVAVRGNDELAVLSHSFNEMAGALQAARRELQLRNVELGETLESLRGTQRELLQNEKLTALGGMLAGLAHELNNPLASVLGNAELLSERLHQLGDPTLKEIAEELADPIAHEALRARELMRNLLQFSRKSELRREPVHVNEAMRVAVALRSYAFAQEGLDLRLNMEPDLWGMGDLQRLEQAFLNVINNAFDALRSRGVGALDVLARRRSDGQVVVVFQDDGPGLEHPERVFDPFYTTKPVGSGTGLGLTLVHQFTEDIGGSVVAENAATGGARFILRFPGIQPPALPACAPVADPPAAPALPVPAAPAPVSAPMRLAPRGDRPLVLVLDDEEPIRNLHARMLRKLEVEVVLGSSGMQGRELLRERPFDLVISDIKMPGEINGIGLFEWVQLERPGLAGRFLFVTGDIHDPALAGLLESRPDRFIMKPFQVKEYLDTVAGLLADCSVDERCA